MNTSVKSNTISNPHLLMLPPPENLGKIGHLIYHKGLAAFPKRKEMNSQLYRTAPI
jgi:hypothetical protein